MTRRIMAALLAAAAIVPGVASAQDRDHRDGRGQRAEQNQGREKAQRERPARAEQRADRRQENARQDRGAEQRQRVALRQDRTNDGVRDVRQDRNNDGRPDYRRSQQQVPALRDRNGDGRLDRYDQRRQVANRGYNATYRGRPNYAANDVRRSWNNNWRNDRRYDWNRYRNYNRGAFHLPRYYAPYGWNNGYRRFSVGIRLAAPLFGENYWIDDPYDYRLPAAYGPYRWVRYYGDAILVDVRSGYVVDVIHDIFW